MNRLTLFSSILIIVLVSAVQAGDIPSLPLDDEGNPALPRGLAPFELELPPLETDDPTHPPTETVRAIAEWEEVEAILFRWGTYNSILSQIIDYVVDVTRAYIVVNSESQANSCRNYLLGQGVSPIDSVEFLIQATNSVWIRDYGPWWLWRLESWDRAMYEWDYNRPRPLDDVIPEWLSQIWNIEYYGIDLTHTGGNWLIDEHDGVYCSQLIRMENGWISHDSLCQIFDAYCNLDSVHLTPMFFGIDHLNMSAKLLNDHTVLVNEFPPASAYNWAMEEIVDVFSNLTNQYGEPWNIIRIPTPDWTPTTYSYTNSLIVQNKVIVPTYNHPYDAEALAIYAENMPGYEVHGINCNGIISAGGAINCITHNIMHPSLIHITHQRLPHTGNITDPYLISAEIISLGTLDEDSLLIYWRSDVNPAWTAEPLLHITGDQFEGCIPPCPGGYVDYYIYTRNEEGNWTTRPRYGPDAHFTFHTGEFLLEVTLTPENPPIVIPSAGGSFNYTINIVNNETSQIDYDAWIEADLPSGGVYETLLREGLTLSPSASLTRYITQNVPPNAPAGEYYYRAAAGEHPDYIFAQDGFPFEKLPGDGSTCGFNDWTISSWDEAVSPFSTRSPDQYILHRNYPNPFNARTTISFTIPEDGYVSLVIYNSLGEEIITLIEGEITAGRCQFQWNAAGMSSGVYFCYLKTPNFTSVRKMMLLR